MRIESGSIYLAAQQDYSQRREVQEQLRVWVSPDRRPSPGPTAGGAASAGRAPYPEADAVIDPKLQIAMWLVEFLTGFKASIVHFRTIEVQAQPGSQKRRRFFAKVLNTRSGWGVSYSKQETYQEKETVFAAAGEITTQDGRKIDFSLSLN